MLITLAMFILAGRSALADYIILNDNGRKVEGIVLPYTDEDKTISIQTTTSKLTFQLSEIKSVEKHEEYYTFMRIGQQYHREGNLDKAGEYLKRAFELNPNDQDVQDALKLYERTLDAEARKQQKMTNQQIDDTIDEIVKLTEKAQFEEALKRYTALAELDPDEVRKIEFRDVLVQIYYQWGLKCIDHVDSAGAMKRLEQAREINPNFKPALDKLIKLYEGDPSKVDEVLKYYTEMLKLNPGDDKIRLKIANASMVKKDWDQAIEHYKVLFLKNKLNNPDIENNLRTAFENSHQEKSNSFDFEGAKQTYEDFAKVFPDIDRTPIFNYEYLLRRQELSDDNIKGHLELAQWCMDNGLDDKAQRHFFHVLRFDKNNEAASKALLHYATLDMQDARNVYQKGNYAGAINLCDEVIEKYSTTLPSIVQAATDLQEEARIKLTAKLKDQAQQAESYYASGEQNFSQAMSFFQQLNDTRYTETSVKIYNPRTEAIRYFKRAKRDYQTAARLDNTLNIKYSISDKIKDCDRYIDRLDSGALPLPPKNRNR
ncbi:hypothetical protein JXA32_08795 [Candidatus Sumerlaeota bacterium]|nr:hypothetical protein [Candidatus Sumerlaeota bacterium]